MSTSTQTIVSTVGILVIFLFQSGILTALALAVRNYQKEHADNTKINGAIRLAGEAVKAIEQMAKTNGWTNPDKLEAAIMAARKLGESKGIVLSDTEWGTLIEAAVHDVKGASAVLVSAPLEAVPAPPINIVNNMPAVDRKAIVAEVMGQIQATQPATLDTTGHSQ